MKKIIPFLLLALLFSCKKGKANFTLKGTITDITFNQNLSGAKIKLYQVAVGTTQEDLIQTATIGNDGTYSFTFPRDKMEKYILRITKNNYFDIEETVYFKDLTIENDNVRNYGTYAKAWVKLTFRNTINPSVSDQFKFIKQLGKEGCSECCSISEQYLYGIVDTSIYCINNGNDYYSYLYFKLNTAFSGSQETQTIAFDTTEIILNY
ncbi:MAG: hypothetical protein RI922_2495 [Bacteroidota bacterium]|jgi:hypothetical protein